MFFFSASLKVSYRRSYSLLVYVCLVCCVCAFVFLREVVCTHCGVEYCGVSIIKHIVLSYIWVSDVKKNFHTHREPFNRAHNTQ